MFLWGFIGGLYPVHQMSIVVVMSSIALIGGSSGSFAG